MRGLLLALAILGVAAWIGARQREMCRHEARWHGNAEWPEIVCE